VVLLAPQAALPPVLVPVPVPVVAAAAPQPGSLQRVVAAFWGRTR